MGGREGKGKRPGSVGNIDVWNLRGAAVPMDKLAPKLIRRAQKKGYIAVIIDPIYKVITGDENSADQMAKFCNQFDLICSRLGCAVIYCHHHSKGAQGGKNAMDRASGSGVFARDPDALLDMIELPVSDALRKQMANNAVVKTCCDVLRDSFMDPEQYTTQDDLCSAPRMIEASMKALMTDRQRDALAAAVQATRARVDKLTAWRIEGTLREFAPFKPVNMWFEYPVHVFDGNEMLVDAKPETDKTWKEKAREKRKENIEHQKNGYMLDIQNAFDMSGANAIAIDDLALTKANGDSISPQTVKGWFGNGSRANDELKRSYEKFIGEDGRTWLRRRNDTDAEGTDN